MRKRVGFAAVVLAVLAAVVAWRATRPDMPFEGADRGADDPSGAPPTPLPDAPGLAPARARAAREDADARVGGDDASPKPAEPGLRPFPFRLEFVDASTGAGVRAHSLSAFHSSSMGGQTLREDECWLRPDGLIHAAFVVVPEGGQVLWDRVPDRHVLAAGVREAWAVQPLHREVVLRLRVLGPDGRPAMGAEVSALEVAGRLVTPVRVDPSGPGEMRVRGIPFLPGEPVAAAIRWEPDGEESGARRPGDRETRPTMNTSVVHEIGPPAEAIEDPHLRTRIPDSPTAAWIEVVNLTGPIGDPASHNETDNDLPFEESLGEGGLTGARGSARVRVLGWDGAPAANATVNGKAADARGEVLLEDVPAGAAEFWMEAPGRFPAHAEALVSAGLETEVVVREPQGARLDVTVTGEDGAPKPSARVTVWQGLVFDVEDGRQRVDPFTDARGRRSFARVEPGESTVTATWGSRRGKVAVSLHDGERTSVEVVVR